MLILDLCGGTGAWSQPYREAGYDVRVITHPGDDVRTYTYREEHVIGVLAAPPCTHLAVSGAKWWEGKGEQALLDGLAVVDACIRIIKLARPQFWALENPVGRLIHYLGPPRYYFHPYYFGDPYTKYTALWGEFNPPEENHVEPTEGSKMNLLPPSPERAMIRSITPSGFARAFFLANNPLGFDLPGAESVEGSPLAAAHPQTGDDTC